MFTLRGISKAYEGVPAIDACDLEVEAQRTTLLIGPSGCGKSTILRMMGGMRPFGVTTPTEGQVLIDGARVAATGSMI